jgi:flavorubredoxin
VTALNTSNVVVMYASAYGNTAALAQAISRGLVKAGVAVNTVNLEVTPLDDVVEAVKASDGFTIGSPTLGGHMPTPVQVSGRVCGGGGCGGGVGWGAACCLLVQFAVLEVTH